MPDGTETVKVEVIRTPSESKRPGSIPNLADGRQPFSDIHRRRDGKLRDAIGQRVDGGLHDEDGNSRAAQR